MTVSKKQLAANCNNAQKGGVKTEEGKAISRFNALKHGLLAREIVVLASDKAEDLPEVDPDDKQELLNYRGAFDLVSDHLNSGSPITEGLIREIHWRLVEGVRGGKAASGEYRHIQNYVVNAKTQEVIYTPPESYEVPRLMQELLDWLNHQQQVHPVLVSGIAQFQRVHIHPFLDGNGRTSRLLSTLCLYRAGYDFKRLFTISECYDRDRAAFYRALQEVRENDMDLTGWLDFFVTGLAKHFRCPNVGTVVIGDINTPHDFASMLQKKLRGKNKYTPRDEWIY